MNELQPFSDGDLDGLTPEQREAVTSSARRLLVRATAGSGKTHVLTLRILRRVSRDEVDADQVLAMTFTRKAADELRRRLFRSGVRDVRAGTFHRAAMTIVGDFRRDHDLRPLTVEPQRRRLVHLLVEQLREDSSFRIEEWQIPRLEQEIGWALSQGHNGASYAKATKRARRDAPLAPPAFADVLDRYVGLCRSRGVVDFDLLLSEAVTLLRDEPTVSASFHYRTRALFVDEAQDMNPLQFTLLRYMAGEDPDLFSVGDPNQSIYGFNGATPHLLREIVATWPDTITLDLTRNHRSTAHIVDVASTLLEPGARGIEPAREGGLVPVVRGYDTDEEEATHVATWLTVHHRAASPWKSMAVLARTNAQLDTIAIALERASIPFERRGADHSPASDLAGDGARMSSPESPDAVALSTIHRSKGLEFAHVVVVGWTEGQLPHFSADTPAEIAEEQRLAYVALSRAEETLLLTWSKGRNDPRFGDRSPSRFLTGVSEAISRIERANAPVTGDARRARLDAIRRELEGAPPSIT